MRQDEIRVLLVEDNPADARLLREAVKEVEGNQIHLTHVDNLGKALLRLDEDRFDVVMLDLSLPDAEGLDTLLTTHNRAPSVPIVVLTGLDDQELAIRAVREGAQDYLVKGQFSGQLLVRAMRYATERKRAIEALQRSENYFRSLTENALDVIKVLDLDGRVRYGSPSFEKVLGFPSGALAGTNAFDLIHPDDRDRVREMLQTGTDHPGAAQHFECRMRHRNGTWRVFESIGKRFEPDSGDSYVINSRDITERKRAEEQLRKVNDTLRAVIEASPLAIYALDLEGNVRSWNTAAQAMFGYSPDDVMHQRLPVVDVDGQAAFAKRLAEATEGQLAAGLEQRLRRKDGSGIEVSIWSAILRDAWGGVDGIVEAVAANTERKRLEEQFRQVQKMEAVGRLAGGIAHDFNNLLTIITGYCQMLLDQLGPDHAISEDMQQVLKAADRATTLTRQLLAFSRRQIVQPRIVDPVALILDMKPMMKRLLGDHIALVIHSHPGVERIRVDPGHLDQVIVNLVVNARDAMPLGGAFRVDILSVMVNAETRHQVIALPEGEYVLFEVTDTGTGMTEEVLSHLFEPFFTTKEPGHGTGLGLSTSYGIIKQNHGEILVRSALGAGTTFSIYLPQVSEPADPPERPASSQRSWKGGETILLAEDEDGVRNVITGMLEKQGYTVLAASGGPNALEIAMRSERHIDMLITDMAMPGMSGHELARQLRARFPGLLVLFVSAYTDTGIVHEGEIDQGTAFLHKPFLPEDLARKVREVLEPGTVQSA